MFSEVSSIVIGFQWLEITRCVMVLSKYRLSNLFFCALKIIFLGIRLRYTWFSYFMSC